jgi:hypothetical protein
MGLDNDDDFYVAPGAADILARAAKGQGAAPEFTYYAAWRPEGGRLAPFGGHDVAQDGPLGSHVDLGEQGELVQTYKAALLADARAAFGPAPPQPDAPSYVQPLKPGFSAGFKFGQF